MTPQKSSINADGFYRRPLPPELIAFSSPEGRKIFAEALATGGMEGYFALAEQFHTQAEPAFCGLGTLVVVLNALSIDPGRIWKGLWRWYTEEFLECCQPLTQVKEQGITFDEFACLARCNGAKVESYRYDESSLENFREAVKKATTSPQGLHIVLSYSRKVLGQTGDGHFSPVGGYHPERDLVLILDVARFKYPSHWVPLPLLWDALRPVDLATGKCRGYLLLSKADIPRTTFYHVALDRYEWAAVSPYFTNILPNALAQEQPNSIASMVRTILLHSALEVTSVISPTIERSNEAQAIWQNLLNEIRSQPLFVIIQDVLSAENLAGKDNLAESLTMLLLACPEDIYKTLNPDLLVQIHRMRELEKLPLLMRQEVTRLREQMSALQDLLLISGSGNSSKAGYQR